MSRGRLWGGGGDSVREVGRRPPPSVSTKYKPIQTKPTCTIDETIYISAPSLVTLVAGSLNHTPPIAKRGWDPYPALRASNHFPSYQSADRPCVTKESTTPFKSGLHMRAESSIRSY